MGQGTPGGWWKLLLLRFVQKWGHGADMADVGEHTLGAGKWRHGIDMADFGEHTFGAGSGDTV